MIPITMGLKDSAAPKKEVAKGTVEVVREISQECCSTLLGEVEFDTPGLD